VPKGIQSESTEKRRAEHERRPKAPFALSLRHDDSSENQNKDNESSHVFIRPNENKISYATDTEVLLRTTNNS